MLAKISPQLAKPVGGIYCSNYSLWLIFIGTLIIIIRAITFTSNICWSCIANNIIISCWFIEKKAGGANVAFHSEPTTEDNNVVVMQNADTLATWCVYDLSSGPLRIRAQVPDTYWSLSLYDMDTNNYYVKNDRQVKDKKLAQIILVRKGQRAGIETGRIEKGIETVVSPSRRGIVIFRNLIRNKNSIPDLIKIQKKAR